MAIILNTITCIIIFSALVIFLGNILIRHIKEYLSVRAGNTFPTTYINRTKQDLNIYSPDGKTKIFVLKASKNPIEKIDRVPAGEIYSSSVGVAFFKDNPNGKITNIPEYNPAVVNIVNRDIAYDMLKQGREDFCYVGKPIIKHNKIIGYIGVTLPYKNTDKKE